MNTVLEAVDILTMLITTGVQDYQILQSISAKIQAARVTNTDLSAADIDSIRQMRDKAIAAFDKDIEEKEGK